MDRICLAQTGCISDIWLLPASLLFIFVLALYCWWRRSVPGAKPLAIACVFGFLWMLGLLGQVATDEVTAKIAWFKFQTVWQVPAATAATCFSLEFAGFGHRLTRRNLLLFSIPPLLAMLMILTNDVHHLWWRDFTVGDTVQPVYGASAGLLVGYGWTLVFVNFIVLIRLFARSHQHRWPVVLMITGQFACRAFFVLYLINLDLLVTPYFLILAIMVPITIYGVALFGFHIFDPLPYARRTAIEQMQEGMVVLDHNWQLLSVNPAAERILGQPAAQLRGKSWNQILASTINGVTQNGSCPFPAMEPDGTLPVEIALRHDVDIRSYEVDLSQLKDQHARVVGRLLLLRDITARKRAQEQRVREQQMLAVIRERERLARELHDSLGQVFAFINAQGQTARILLQRGELDAADVHMTRLVDVARESDTDIRESILGLRTRLSEDGFFSALTAYLKQFQQRYGICVCIRQSPDFADATMDPLVELQLMRIIQEALTNVRKHAHATSVSIDFGLVDGAAVTTLKDDGCGFDRWNETAGDKGRLGFRVMQERVEEIDGHIQIFSTPGHGTTVQVTVPLAWSRVDRMAIHPVS